MDTTYRQFMVKRLAAVKQRKCYIEIFKLIVEHKVASTFNMNGVFFHLSSLSDELAQQIDEIIKMYEQQKQEQVAICV
jgi:hypothetical protein